jgi:uncharacterized protein YjbI with pentapeptide repeats
MDNTLLDHAYLGSCQFHPNRAYGLKLRGAVLIRCKFTAEHGPPELTRAQLRAATVIESNLEGVCLIRADFTHAILLKCNLHHAQLRDAVVDKASLVGCVTLGAELPAALFAG